MLLYYPEIFSALILLLVFRIFLPKKNENIEVLKLCLLDLKQGVRIRNREQASLYLEELLKECHYLSCSFFEKAAFLDSVLLKIIGLYKKNNQIFSIFLFRAFLFFSLCLLSEVFVRSFLYTEVQELNKGKLSLFLSLGSCFSFFVFSFFKEKQIKSSFFKDSFSKEGRSWLRAYFLAKPEQKASYTKNYLKLKDKALFSGVSTEKEKKSLLEVWLKDQICSDLQKQEKSFETLPFYELFLYSVFFLCSFFLHFSFILNKISQN